MAFEKIAIIIFIIGGGPSGRYVLDVLPWLGTMFFGTGHLKIGGGRYIFEAPTPRLGGQTRKNLPPISNTYTYTYTYTYIHVHVHVQEQQANNKIGL